MHPVGGVEKTGSSQARDATNRNKLCETQRAPL
jgi:hypothetical protein